MLSVFLIASFHVNAGPDPPDVTITSSGSSAIAGTTHSLTCDVTLAQVLRERPVIEWVWSNATWIENGTLEGVLVFSSLPYATLTLTFVPLHTSHGGIYQCRARVMDSNATLFLSSDSSYSLTVQSELTYALQISFKTSLVNLYHSKSGL